MDNEIVRCCLAKVANSINRTYIENDEAISSLYQIEDFLAADNNSLKTEYALEIVFDKDGIFSFVRVVLRKQQINQVTKEHEDIIKEIFVFIYNIVKDYPAECQKYVMLIMEECRIYVRSGSSMPARNKAYEILRLIVERKYLDNERSAVLALMLSDALTKADRNVTDKTEPKCIYQLIGIILESYPEVVIPTVSKQILRHLLTRLGLEMKKNNVSVVLLEGLFDCLLSFLKNFFDVAENNKTELYKQIKEGCNTQKKKKVSERVALKIVELHNTLFVEHMIEDYEWWHVRLIEHVQADNKEDQQAAFCVLEKLYPSIATQLKTRTTEKDKTMLEYFLENMKYYLNSALNTNDFRVILSMKYYGSFADACRRYKDVNHVKDMFDTIKKKIEICIFRVSNGWNFLRLSDLLLSLTEIVKCLKDAELQVEDFNIMIKLTVLVIDSYPKISAKYHQGIVQSLMKSILNVALCSEAVVDLYLQKVIHVGIIKSCSYLIENDINTLKNFTEDESTDQLVSCKQFIQLWKELCEFEDDSIDEMQLKKKLSIRIFDIFVRSTLLIIDQLDLTFSDQIQENNVVSDTAQYNAIRAADCNEIPNTESDFCMFINLVELFSNIVSSIDAEKLEKWLSELTSAFIDHALKCKSKSGFYQLLTTVFRRYSAQIPHHEFDLNMIELNSFLNDTLDHVKDLKGADLFWSLRMLLNSPLVSVPSLILNFNPVFQMVFTLGHEDIGLAKEGLKTLKLWYLKDLAIRPILDATLPYLNKFLKSEKYIGDASTANEEENRLLMPLLEQGKKRLFIKHRKILVQSRDTELNDLKMEIANLIGILDLDLCLALLADDGAISVADTTELLTFQLPFVDAKIDIFLDKLLPRVIDLSTNSGDLKTRVAACEVFHSIAIVFIAKSLDLEKRKAETLFRKITLTVFKLGCDVNDVLNQLFRPLSLQIIHYYSSKFQKGSCFTATCIEIMFENMTDEDNISLRDFAGELMREFVSCSIRNENTDSLNIRAIIRRICLFATHPNSYKRLGATHAFNNIYDKLREEDYILDDFWIDLSYHISKGFSLNINMYDTNNLQSSLAMDRLKRVLIEKASLFLQSNNKRRTYNELPDVTLSGLLIWFLKNCTSFNRYCRTKCMELVTGLSVVLPEFNSMKDYFDSFSLTVLFSYILPNGMDDFNKLNNISSIVGWLKQLLSYLECAVWLSREHAIDSLNLLNDGKLLICTEKFLVSYIPNNLLTVSRGSSCEITKDLEHTYENHKILVFTQILQLIIEADASTKQVFIGEDEWQTNLWKCFALYLFNWRNMKMGLDTKDYVKKLLSEVLISLKMHFSSQQLAPICNEIRAQITLSDRNLVRIDSIILHDEPISTDRRQLLDALTILQCSCIIQDILPIADILPDTNSLKKNLIDDIFSAMGYNGNAITPSSVCMLYLEEVLKFALEQTKDVEHIFRLLLDETRLEFENTKTKEGHGSHFLNTFKKPIVEHFLYHQQEYMIDMFLNRISRRRFKIATVCLQHSSKQYDFSILQHALEENMQKIIDWISMSEKYEHHLISLLAEFKGKNGTLRKPELFFVFKWLMNQLTEKIKKQDSTATKNIIQFLPLFLGDTSNLQFHNCLINTLQHISPNNFSDPETLRLVFKTLIDVLTTTRDVSLFESIILISTANHNLMLNDNFVLPISKLMCRLSFDNQLSILDIPFSLFKEGKNANCLEIEIVLLKMAKKEAVKSFYVKHFSYIVELLEMKQTAQQGLEEAEKLFFTQKLGALQLVEIFYTIVEDVDDEDLRKAAFPNNSERILKKELSKISKSIVVSMKCCFKSNQALRLRVQCLAYNSLVMIIRRTAKREEFFTYLFSETRDNRIWSNVVDTNTPLHLKMTFEQFPHRKKILKRQRKELRNHLGSDYLPSQYLSTSSLVHDVTKFDFTSVAINDNENAEDSNLVTYEPEGLEMDVLNKHECMSTLCDLINFMADNKIYQVSHYTDDMEITPLLLPKWMEKFRWSLRSYLEDRLTTKKNRNVIIFLLKVIDNCQKIFQPFADYWINDILEAVNYLNDLNYFIADVITMLLYWSVTDLPIDRKLTTNVLLLLMRTIDRNRPTVRKYQMELIMNVICTWSRWIDIPYLCLKNDLEAHPAKEVVRVEISLEISKRFLLNYSLPYDEETKIAYLKRICVLSSRDFQQSRVKHLVFQVIGLILRYHQEKMAGVYVSEKEELTKSTVETLKRMNDMNAQRKVDMFLSCVLDFLTYMPSLVPEFVAAVIFNFGRLRGELQSKCLQILLLDCDHLPKTICGDLLSHDLSVSLTNIGNYDFIKNALMFIKKFAENLTIGELDELIPKLVPLSKHRIRDIRSFTYDIMQILYLKFRKEDGFESIACKLKVCLLNGLLDNDSDLQERIFKFWSELECASRTSLPDNFLHILEEMYSQENESEFVSNSVNLLLHACSFTPDFDTMLVQNPLGEDKFEEHKVMVNWRRRHSSLAPMFMNTLSNRLSSLSSQSIGSETGSFVLNIRRTQNELVFQPTFFQNGSVNNEHIPQSVSASGFTCEENFVPDWSTSTASDDSLFKNPNDYPSTFRKCRLSSGAQSSFFAARSYKRGVRLENALDTRAQRSRRDVQFYRKYRKGELPDVQIPMSAIILPIRMLAKRDKIIAQQLFLDLFSKILSKHENPNEYLSNVNTILQNILRSNHLRNSCYLSTLFEIAARYSKNICLNIHGVVLAAHHSENLLSLAAMLTENEILKNQSNRETVAQVKRLKANENSTTDQLWMHIAKVYKSLNIGDVVNGVLKEKVNNIDVLKKGLEFEENSRWEEAWPLYKNEVDKFLENRTSSIEDERLLLDAYYECTAHLSKWNDLHKVTGAIITRNNVENWKEAFDALWTEEWNVEHTLKWYLTSEVCCCLEKPEKLENTVYPIVSSWMLDEEKKIRIINVMGEQLSALSFMTDHVKESQFYVNESIKSVLNEWISSPVTADKLMELQTLSEISNLLSVDDMSDYSKLESMLKVWWQNSPKSSNLTMWDRRILHRLYFAKKFTNHLQSRNDFNEDYDCTKNLIHNFESYIKQSYLQLAEKAVTKKNYQFGVKHILEYDKLHENNKLDPSFLYTYSKLKALRASRETCSQKSVTHFYEALQKLDGIGIENHDFNYWTLLSDIFEKIKDTVSIANLNEDQRSNFVDIICKISNRNVEETNFSNDLEDVVFNCLINAVDRSSRNDVASAHLSLAKFCSKGLREDDVMSQPEDKYYFMEERLIGSVLNAMKHDSLEANQFFPSLLRLPHLLDFENQFKREVDAVETWKFLPWINQLIVYLDTSIVNVIADLVLKLAELYPKAMQFPFMLSSMTFSYDHRPTESVVEKLKEILQHDVGTSEFLKAMSYVCDPVELIKHKMKTAKSSENSNYLKETFDSLSNDPFVGSIHQFAMKLPLIKKVIDGLLDSSTSYDRAIHEMNSDEISNLRKDGFKRYSSEPLLRSFSPMLLKWDNREVEIPGQYTGYSIPQTRQHVRVYKFHETVQMMDSMRRPIKITIIGDDAKYYSYLVKFNEDLRQDQRIGQLLDVMDQRLRSDPDCVSKKLRLNTYGVFPLTTSLGMIEWVEKTAVLKQFIFYKNSMTAEQKKIPGNIYKNGLSTLYSKYTGRAPPKREPEMYKMVVFKGSQTPTDLISNFRKVRKSLPEDVFRQSMMTLCERVDVFWNFRNQFITSYTTMSACTWILGIGDRHLDNTLVSVHDGLCTAIDFGYAFGNATDCLQIVELIPFRMTPQIQHLMAPFRLTGLIQETLVTVLDTIRSFSHTLLAPLEIFVLEPTLNWLETAKRHNDDNGNEDDEDLAWYPTNKIDVVRKKLEGYNPTGILEQEVKSNRSVNSDFAQGYIRLLNGDTNSKRNQFPQDHLTARQQALILLELATDEYILGTSYIGLNTWI